jgi:macrolide transport system ATP-binding/permease protein
VGGRLDIPVSIDVRGGAKLVVHGPNGAGKSTMLALMAGELSPTAGTVRRSPSVRIGFLRQEVDFPPNVRAHTLFEQHVGRLVSTGTIRSSQTIGLGSLGLLEPREESKRIGELSMGQVRRLALAMVLAARPNTLLLDEPTNHLSMTLVDELTHGIRATPAAVVVSTHDRQLLRDLADWERMTLPGAQE